MATKKSVKAPAKKASRPKLEAKKFEKALKKVKAVMKDREEVLFGPTVAAKLKAPQPPESAQNQGRSELGIENHAIRTVAWAVGLGLIDKSVLADATRASHKSELIEALEIVKQACEGHDYLEQALRIEELKVKLSRHGE